MKGKQLSELCETGRGFAVKEVFQCRAAKI
jgi:hypothetical protein